MKKRLKIGNKIPLFLKIISIFIFLNLLYTIYFYINFTYFEFILTFVAPKPLGFYLFEWLCELTLLISIYNVKKHPNLCYITMNIISFWFILTTIDFMYYSCITCRFLMLGVAVSIIIYTLKNRLIKMQIIYDNKIKLTSILILSILFFILAKDNYWFCSNHLSRTIDDCWSTPIDYSFPPIDSLYVPIN